MCLMIFAIEDAKIEKTQQKTPPDGEKGGEKQYKDYEKNPMLSFVCSFDAANIGKNPICNVFSEIFTAWQP